MLSQPRPSSYEIPRICVLSLSEFSAADGLLTPTFKNARPKIRARFKAELQAMYESEDSEYEKKKLQEMLSATLGHGAGSFSERGGDSLSAIRLIEKIKKEFNVAVPVNLLMAENGSPSSFSSRFFALSHRLRCFPDVESAITKFIEAQRPTGTTGPEITPADGFLSSPPSTVDFARETILPEDIRFNRNLSGLSLDKVGWKNLFLTGATGFLGAFMMADLLNQSEKPVVKCLVRAKSEEDGMSRLKKALRKYDISIDSGALPQDTTLFWHILMLFVRKEQWSRVSVCVGDLAEPRFGLEDDAWTALVEWTDQLFHAGAWVNGVFDYQTLKAANVGGTIECLRLCSAASFHESVRVLRQFPAFRWCLYMLVLSNRLDALYRCTTSAR